MKETSANIENEERKFYLSEFSYDDGEYEITFYIIGVNFIRDTITVDITRCGKISRDTFNLIRDKDDRLYFEHGIFYENKIFLDDFANVA